MGWEKRCRSDQFSLDFPNVLYIFRLLTQGKYWQKVKGAVFRTVRRDGRNRGREGEERRPKVHSQVIYLLKFRTRVKKSLNLFMVTFFLPTH